MADTTQLPFLLKLLDDDTEGTQEAIAKEFAKFEGDVSDDLASLAIDLSPEDKYRVSELLHPGRRENLTHEWIVPHNLDDDWESFEHLLRLLCDYMHDGITIRPSLHDSLDILAEDVEFRIPSLSSNKLRKYLFADHLFTGARTNYYALFNSDLCYALNTGKGNPITLCLIFQLIAQRHELEVSSSNYPGHFLSRIHLNNKAHLVDCYNMGRLIPVDELLTENKELSTEAKYAIKTEAPARAILHRILRNMEHSFSLEKKTKDALLMQKLQSTLVK